MTEPLNPYAPPQAPVADVPDPSGPWVLAGRGARLGAVLIDTALLMAVVLTPLYLLGWVEHEPGVLETVRNGLFGLVGFVLINGVLLARHGQTMGKRLVGLRIVRSDGSVATLGRLLGLRYGVGMVVGMVPALGALYSLVDSLLIFRASRQCLHDTIADTIVINK